MDEGTGRYYRLTARRGHLTGVPESPSGSALPLTPHPFSGHSAQPSSKIQNSGAVRIDRRSDIRYPDKGETRDAPIV